MHDFTYHRSIENFTRQREDNITEAGGKLDPGLDQAHKCGWVKLPFI